MCRSDCFAYRNGWQHLRMEQRRSYRYYFGNGNRYYYLYGYGYEWLWLYQNLSTNGDGERTTYCCDKRQHIYMCRQHYYPHGERRYELLLESASIGSSDNHCAYGDHYIYSDGDEQQRLHGYQSGDGDGKPDPDPERDRYNDDMRRQQHYAHRSRGQQLRMEYRRSYRNYNGIAYCKYDLYGNDNEYSRLHGYRECCGAGISCADSGVHEHTTNSNMRGYLYLSMRYGRRQLCMEYGSYNAYYTGLPYGNYYLYGDDYQ